MNRKVVSEFSTIKEAVTFCDNFCDTNMKKGWVCHTKNNGWTVSEPVTVPGWLMDGIEYSKVFSLKIIDSNPINEVMSELANTIRGRVASEPIDIGFSSSESE